MSFRSSYEAELRSMREPTIPSGEDALVTALSLRRDMTVATAGVLGGRYYQRECVSEIRWGQVSDPKKEVGGYNSMFAQMQAQSLRGEPVQFMGRTFEKPPEHFGDWAQAMCYLMDVSSCDPVNIEGTFRYHPTGLEVIDRAGRMLTDFSERSGNDITMAKDVTKLVAKIGEVGRYTGRPPIDFDDYSHIRVDKSLRHILGLMCLTVGLAEPLLKKDLGLISREEFTRQSLGYLSAITATFFAKMVDGVLLSPLPRSQIFSPNPYDEVRARGLVNMVVTGKNDGVNC